MLDCGDEDNDSDADGNDGMDGGCGGGTRCSPKGIGQSHPGVVPD